MSTWTAAAASFAHLAGVALAVTFAVLRLMALRRRDVAAIRFADNGNGLAAILLFGGGLWRFFAELEKPTPYYTENPVFWIKMGLVGAVVALEIYPQVVVLPWHIRHARKQPIEPKPGQIERLYRCVLPQLPCLAGIGVCAVLMARGIGLPSTPAPPPSDHPGQAIYVARCQVCHQADGRGLGGRTAASFVDDARILARSDAELLDVIARGKTGPVGAMPGWNAILTPDEQRAVLAYIRATYAPR